MAGGHCGDVASGTGMNGVDAHRRKLDGEVSHHAGDRAIRHRDRGRFRIGPIARAEGYCLGLGPSNDRSTVLNRCTIVDHASL